jgi:hypothetical protein
MRWISGKISINRPMNTEEYFAHEKLWLAQQCFSCQFYIPLRGEMGRIGEYAHIHHPHLMDS